MGKASNAQIALSNTRVTPGDLIRLGVIGKPASYTGVDSYLFTRLEIRIDQSELYPDGDVSAIPHGYIARLLDKEGEE